MTDDLLTFNISGQAMSVIEGSELSNNPVNYDGGSTGAVDAHASLRDSRRRRMGRGWTYRVTTSREGALTILDYCLTVGETFAGETEPDTRADGRALLLVAQRLTELTQPTEKGSTS